MQGTFKALQKFYEITMVLFTKAIKMLFIRFFPIFMISDRLYLKIVLTETEKDEKHFMVMCEYIQF